jgi:hypothetical protein
MSSQHAEALSGMNERKRYAVVVVLSRYTVCAITHSSSSLSLLCAGIVPVRRVNRWFK